MEGSVMLRSYEYSVLPGLKFLRFVRFAMYNGNA